MNRQWILWGVLILLMLAGVAFGQVDRSGEVATLKQGLESTSRSARIDAAKRITQAGLTDGELYDKVGALLQAGYGEAVEANAVDEMAWLCKALAASGDTRHQPLLEEVATLAPNVKLQKYARQSIDSFAEHQERIRVLNATTGWNAALSDTENRLVGMLGAESAEIKRDAAKTIVRDSPVAEGVYDAAASALTGMLAAGILDNLTVDTMAWLCKAMAASGNGKYAPALEQVAASGNKKLAKFANAALQELR